MGAGGKEDEEERVGRTTGCQEGEVRGGVGRIHRAVEELGRMLRRVSMERGGVTVSPG